jgi:hypothetical protein
VREECLWAKVQRVCAADFHLTDTLSTALFYNVSCTFAQAIHDELQQLDTGLQQLDGATRAAMAEVDDDHRRAIAQSVSNLAARIKELEDERQKQESDLIKKQTEWNDYQVRE